MVSNPSPTRVGLVRALGPLMATAVVIGTVIGSGVFKKPQIVSENLPYFGLAALVWILGGLFALMGSLAYAEVAVLYPRAGGNYVFLREGYGRLAGFLWGWIEFCIIRSASIAALATIFAESLHDVLRNSAFQSGLGVDLGSEPLGFWGQRWLTVAIILGLGIVNVLGVRWGGGLQLFITIIKIGSLIAIALLPFLVWRLSASDANAPAPNPANLSPVWPAWDALSLSKIGTALLAVIWAYHGWMNIALVAEEVRSPRRNIPLSLLSGVAVIITLYLAANLGYYLIIPQPEIAAVPGDTNVATVFSLRLLGPIGAAAASAAVMCSVFGALNGNLLVGPRLLYAMGEDRMAPSSLSTVHPRFRTPALAILVMAVWSCLLVLGGGALIKYRLPTFDFGSWTLDINPPKGKALFDLMTDFAMFAAIIFETSAVCTVFVFRWRYPNAERPYRCLGYPVVPIVYAITFFLIAANTFVTQRTESLAVLGFVAAGMVVYFLFARGRSDFVPLTPTSGG
jgi:basic amino acid/polyamine antiporter, APA family